MKNSEILKLSIPERILLVETIWDSIAAESKELDIPKYHKEILKEELIAYKSNPHEVSTWEEVKKSIKKKKK
jgi:putative addiction module component (TIGR02574 family)